MEQENKDANGTLYVRCIAKEFTAHRLNETGLRRAKYIAEAFDDLVLRLATECTATDRIDSREWAITRTKLEEACFFAKKAMATQTKNQQQDQ